MLLVPQAKYVEEAKTMMQNKKDEPPPGAWNDIAQIAARWEELKTQQLREDMKKEEQEKAAANKGKKKKKITPPSVAAAAAASSGAFQPQEKEQSDAQPTKKKKKIVDMVHYLFRNYGVFLFLTQLSNSGPPGPLESNSWSNINYNVFGKYSGNI